MSRKYVEPNLSPAVPDLTTESAAQEVYFLPEVGQQFREGQAVTYEVGIDEAGRHYALNVQIVDEPSVH
ncbi:hypothetical protein [Pseudomonas sp. UBA6562]|uniref:hypothetical protein n=1 Tax=Pseudomonas sp. UBA6562 TaxID=1947332 RepID=UPI0025E6E431|nr:hypothetical protein [Pseudomonas sp. UBA6562]